MKYAYFIIMHCLEQENRTSNKIVAAKSFYHTFLHYSIKLTRSYEIHEICDYVQCTAFKILIKGYL